MGAVSAWEEKSYATQWYVERAAQPGIGKTPRSEDRGYSSQLARSGQLKEWAQSAQFPCEVVTGIKKAGGAPSKRSARNGALETVMAFSGAEACPCPFLCPFPFPCPLASRKA